MMNFGRIFKNLTCTVRTALATFGRTWASFYSNIRSHWMLVNYDCSMIIRLVAGVWNNNNNSVMVVAPSFTTILPKNFLNNISLSRRLVLLAKLSSGVCSLDKFFRLLLLLLLSFFVECPRHIKQVNAKHIY